MSDISDERKERLRRLVREHEDEALKLIAEAERQRPLVELAHRLACGEKVSASEVLETFAKYKNGRRS